MKIFAKVHPSVVLSQLWIFFLFCIFFADFQWLVTAGALEEIASGVVRGNTVTPELLVLASVVHLIPVLMVILSRLTVRAVNRWLNIIMGVFNLLIATSSGWTSLDQIIFKVVMVVSMLLVIWTAWTWKDDQSLTKA